MDPSQLEKNLSEHLQSKISTGFEKEVQKQSSLMKRPVGYIYHLFVEDDQYREEMLKRLIAESVKASLKLCWGASYRMSYKISRFIVKDIVVRRGEKGYRLEMSALCALDSTIYGVVLLTKRDDVVEMFSERPYEFLDHIADLSFMLGGKKKDTHCAKHPTLGRLFLRCLSQPLKEREEGKKFYTGSKSLRNEELRKLRIDALKGRGDFAKDPILRGMVVKEEKSAQDAVVVEQKAHAGKGTAASVQEQVEEEAPEEKAEETEVALIEEETEAKAASSTEEQNAPRS